MIKTEHHEMIINMGVFNYGSKKIANILELDHEYIEKEIQNKDSEINKLLQKGCDLSDYVIDLKLFDLAKLGDLKALEKLDKRRKLQGKNA